MFRVGTASLAGVKWAFRRRLGEALSAEGKLADGSIDKPFRWEQRFADGPR